MILFKKGIVFSLMALAMAVLFTTLFFSYYQQPLDQGNEAVKTRVLMLNKGIIDFYQYSEKALSISAYKSLQLLYNKINTTGNYISQGYFEKNLSACMMGEEPCLGNPDNISSYLDNFTKVLNNDLRVPLQYVINNITISGESRWSLKLRANISVSLIDSFASWNLYKIINSTVNNTGLYDPLFTQYGFAGNDLGGVEYRRIKPNLNDQSNWDLSSFSEFYFAREYRASFKGPCLSDRYEGHSNTNPDCAIETILNPDVFVKLKEKLNVNLSQLDYSIINNEHFVCNTTEGLQANARYTIPAVNINITLSGDDIASFNLEQERDNARCCPGYKGTNNGLCP